MDRARLNEISEGTEVVGSDGDRIGQVLTVHDEFLIVEKDMFSTSRYYIPHSAITAVDGGQVRVNVTKDDARDQGWDRMPEEGAYAATATTADRLDDTTSIGETAATRRTLGTDTDHLTVPIHEEELAARTREVELGEVRIEKDVVSEERVVEVPVTEERVRVQRHAVDRDVTGDPDAFVEGTIQIPVMGEEVDLETRVRVTEELEIDKEAVQHTEQVTGTVRREEIRVEDETAVTGTALGDETTRDAGRGRRDRR
jgi:uncharacterized protein (TIGR02271 family)